MAFRRFENGKTDFAGVPQGTEPSGFNQKLKIADPGSGFGQDFDFVPGVELEFHIARGFHTASGDAEIFQQRLTPGDS
jgi:hypothetical protein